MPRKNDRWWFRFKEVRFGAKAFPAALKAPKASPGWEYVAVWIQYRYEGAASKATMRSDSFSLVGPRLEANRNVWTAELYTFPAVYVAPNDDVVVCTRGELHGFTFVYLVEEGFPVGSVFLAFGEGTQPDVSFTFQRIGDSVT